ncbi:MAG: hypothetical protein NC241_08685 [Bacteroides sp.]|nr:hypothetical protein [Bacteroides sp.]MCM1458427.1 hypothetical protein [Lachnoclostridium sp.]
MKNRILIFVATLMLGLVCAAQEREVTKFLGIPVDGTKSEMIQKLKAKGFTPTESDKDVLEGEFNGHDVRIYTVTNNRKVYRIRLADENKINETSIKIRFNNLVSQFEKNRKYRSYGSQRIADDEDISYEMSVHKKRYEAVFYQNAFDIAPEDTTAIFEKIYSLQSERFSPAEIANPTPEIKEELSKIERRFWDDYFSVSERCVWFMIVEERYGKYYISMYYDNRYNEANGEDL